MTIENLRCFLILAQELNFTRAAAKAHVTQTAMSRKILSIEEELSIKLFERTHHRVSLTNAGQEFYYQISTMLKSYDTAVTQAQNMDKGVRDSVQIGVGVYEHALLRPVIQDFIHQHPISKLNCVQFKYHELIESFDHGNMDLIITSDQFLQTIDQEDLELILVHDYPWCLVLDQNNPLARKEVVDMADLHTQNIITMNQGSISVIRSLFRPWFPLTSIDYVNSWETKLTLVNAGRGVGFIPAFVDVSPYPDVVTRSLHPFYRPRKFYAIIRKSNTNLCAYQLAQALEAYYQPKLWLQEC
ncbi:LysR family transcriptional regulator [bacterium 1xD42-67]|jgi:DNA-binding transcriptional LysR family regulator|nr:LysR family transcriptional regulator [Lawsonibacter sp.]MCI9567703.1 LysR family transcriptional regulator [Lawsonibacter sp.]RKI69350.1 LysR family transcriptional regulator [bacterium 1xD42-67]